MFSSDSEEEASSLFEMNRLKEENEKLRNNVLQHQIESNRQIENYETKLVHSEEIKKQLQQCCQERDDLKSRVEIAARQFLDQKQKLENIINLDKQNSTRQIIGLQDQIGALTKKVKKLKNEKKSLLKCKNNAEYQQKTAENKLEDLVHKLSSFFQTNIDSIDNLNNLFINYSSKQDDHNVKRYKIKCKLLDEKIISLKEQTELYSRNYQEKISNLKRENEKLHEDIKSLTKQVPTVLSQYQICDNSDYSQTMLKNEVLSKNIKDLRDVNKSLNEQIANNKIEIQMLKNSTKAKEIAINSSSQKAFHKAKAKISKQKEAIESLQEEINRLKNDKKDQKITFLEHKLYEATSINPTQCIDKNLPNELINSLCQVLGNEQFSISKKISKMTNIFSSFLERKYNHENKILSEFIPKICLQILNQTIDLNSFLHNESVRESLIKQLDEVLQAAGRSVEYRRKLKEDEDVLLKIKKQLDYATKELEKNKNKAESQRNDQVIQSLNEQLETVRSENIELRKQMLSCNRKQTLDSDDSLDEYENLITKLQSKYNQNRKGVINISAKYSTSP